MTSSPASGTSARQPLFAVGTPDQVADEIERWLDEVGIDGINLLQYHSYDTAKDFIELVVPVLRERGRLRSSYDEDESLRDRIFGEGDRLPERHHGTRYRGGANLPISGQVHPESRPAQRLSVHTRRKNHEPPTPPPRPHRRQQASLAASLLAACGAGSTEAGGKPVKGGTITYAHVQEPPCIFGGWIQQAYISRQVLDGLVTLDEDGTVKPWLATEWKVSPDGLTYTFTLKDGVKFTDGTPVDAEAVAWNFDLWENTDGNGTAKVSIDPYYKSAEAIDPTHVEISLNKPYPQFLTLITQGYFGIQSPTALKSPLEGGELREADRVRRVHRRAVEARRGGRARQEPELHLLAATAKHQGPALVDKVRWKFVADGVSRYASLTTGESDVDLRGADRELEGRREAVTTPSATSLPASRSPSTSTPSRASSPTSWSARPSRTAPTGSGAVEAGFHGVIPYEGNPSVSQATPGYNADAAKDYAYDPEKAASPARPGRLDQGR